jgi:hypothetical protein
LDPGEGGSAEARKEVTAQIQVRKNSMKNSQITQEKLQDSQMIEGSNEKSELLRHVFQYIRDPKKYKKTGSN